MAFPAPVEPINLPLPDPEAYPGEPREYARALMERKDEIEREIDSLKDVLASHAANADTPLVDPEGFPRADIDVYAIRHTRAALTRLYNDRSEAMRRLASALEAAFEPGNPNGASSTPAPTPQSNGSVPPATAAAVANGHRAPALELPDQWPERPIARVNTVEPNGPGAEAGLQPGDVIYSFSGITATSPGGLQAIGPIVARSEGSPLTLLILRGTERKMLRLTPRRGWGGNGLIGCHILPV